MKKNNIQNKIKFCLLVAIEMIVCFTPLGSIPIGPIVATISMLPVIVTTLHLGLYSGIFMGFLFGTFSFIVWTFMPPNVLLAFLFTPFYSLGNYSGNFCSLIICFFPRILIAVTTYWTNIIIKHIFNERISMVISSFIGSMTNTILVMLFIWLFFGIEYETILESDILFIIKTTIMTNGLLEAMICVIISPTICYILNKRG